MFKSSCFVFRMVELALGTLSIGILHQINSLPSACSIALICPLNMLLSRLQTVLKHQYTYGVEELIIQSLQLIQAAPLQSHHGIW